MVTYNEMSALYAADSIAVSSRVDSSSQQLMSIHSNIDLFNTLYQTEIVKSEFYALSVRCSNGSEDHSPYSTRITQPALFVSYLAVTAIS
jgi:hypothetical protein